MPEIANQKYLLVVKAVVKDHFLQKLLNWVEHISDTDKRGLRIIKAVVDIKGEKRFKKPGVVNEEKGDTYDLTKMTTE